MKEFQITGKTIENALGELHDKHAIKEGEYEYEVVDPGSKGFLRIGSRDAEIKIRLKPTYFARSVRDYIESILKYSNGGVKDMDLQYNTKGSKIFIQLKGEQLGRIIGKHGKTISALQHLSNIYVNRITDVKATVYIEVGDYKDRRKDIIKKIAVQNAKKVKSSKKKVELDPMFAFERRIVHEVIKSISGVKSFSKGLEPYRFVVLLPVNGQRHYSSQGRNVNRRKRDEKRDSKRTADNKR